MPVITSQDISWLLDRIVVLETALAPFAQFAEVFKTQQNSPLVPKTGNIYGIENRAGSAVITVEHLEAALRARNPPPRKT